MKILTYVFYISLIYSSLIAQPNEIQFDNITTFHGLSNARTKCIYQDSKGYLWFGTLNGGVNRYDGNSFSVYKSEPDNPNSIIHDNIYAIDEDQNGNLWFAASEGISKYIPAENKFNNFILREYFEAILNYNYSAVYAVLIDSKGRNWLGHSHLGIIKYSEEDSLFSVVQMDVEKSDNPEVITISDIEEDEGNIIWAASSRGLFFYEEASSTFKPAEMNANSRELLQDQYIFRLYPDSEQNMWLMSATDLFKYNPASGNVVHLLNYKIASPINSGYEGEIWEDENGDMWVAHINLENLYQFPGLSNEYIKFESEKITATDFLIDTFGTIWVSDWYKGLYKFDPLRQSFSRAQGKSFPEGRAVDALTPSKKNPDEIFISIRNYGWGTYNKISQKFIKYGSRKNINTVLANDDGSFWVGSWGDGIQKWNPRTKNYTKYFTNLPNSENLPDGRITKIDRSENNMIWFGSINGLYRMNNDGTELEQILKDIAVIRFIIDGNIIWCGTYGRGLLKFDQSTNEIITFQHDKNSNSISNNIVWDLYQSEDGTMWLGTNKGLNRFNPQTEEFKVFLQRDGLADDRIASILPGEGDEIWFSTTSGITHLHYDPTNRIIFSNYDSQDGLTNAVFRNPISLKDDQNRYYFGGENGLYYFTPVENKSQPPVIHITDITVNGNSVQNSLRETLYLDKNNSGNIELGHDENNVEIEFIGLHYSQPTKNRYAYFLEGFDEDWIIGSERSVNYSSLEPGNYKFTVKAVNNEGVWSTEDKSVEIIINKPWWNTWFAYTAYIGFFFVSLFAVRRFELNRQKEKENKNLLEAENRRKTQELEEARQLQLSMLPKQIPQLPNLDIAVYMKTATEVGGDYYDFHVGMDGTLTVVIGDATGHGMKAGTMVTTTKSLFRVLAPNPDVTGTFNEMTKCIKEMDMPKLSMCMTLAKFTNGSLNISTAGMPPAYYHNSLSGEVSELLTKGMPLGTFTDFPYEAIEVKLSKGDTILLLSDGLPELLSEAGEMYGYERLNGKFREVAEKNPEDIINVLKDTASEWINDKDPGDDVTFVVIKVK